MDSSSNLKNTRLKEQKKQTLPHLQETPSIWLAWVAWKEVEKKNIDYYLMLASLETAMQQPSSSTSTYYF